jgi:RNA polymerase sigma factor (sigma-70 family)
MHPSENNLQELFGSLLKDNQQSMLRICRAYSGSKEDQKDLFQEVLLNIWKSLPSFRATASIDTWIYRICLNVCMQFARSSKRANRWQNDQHAMDIWDKSQDLLSNIEQGEKIKSLYSCISALSEADRTIILLFLEELQYRAISEIMGISENHVAVKVVRIKKKLLSCLKDKSDERK